MARVGHGGSGVIEPGNIDLNSRPVVKNPDGSISTVRSRSFSFGGVETLLPTVSPEGRILTDSEAVQLYKKTGQHLGKFVSPQASTEYAQNLHLSQADQYGKGTNMAEQGMDDLSWNTNFRDAFSVARQRGLLTFDWKGKRYQTNLNDPLGLPTSPPVPSASPPPLQSIQSPTAPPTPQLPPANLNDPMGPRQGEAPPPTTVPYRPGEQDTSSAGIPKPEVGPAVPPGESSQMTGGAGAPTAQWPPLMDQALVAAPKYPALDLIQQQGPEQDPYYAPPEAPAPVAATSAPVPQAPPLAAPVAAQQSSQPSGFDAASQRLDPSYAPGPPKTPEEKAYRMEGWKQFIQKISTDPGLQMMALKMGTQMMQPVPLGGNAASHLGASLQSGVDYGLAYNEIQRKAAMEQGAGAMQDRVSEQSMAESRQRVSSAQTTQVGQHQAQQELLTTWPERREKFQIDIGNAKNESDVIKLQHEVARFQLANKDKLVEIELKTAQARLAAEQARLKAYERELAKADGKDKDGLAAIAGAKAFVAATNEQVTQAWIDDVKDREKKTITAADVPLALAREKFFFMNPGMAKEFIKHAAIAGLAASDASVVAAKAASDAHDNPPGSEGRAKALSAETEIAHVKGPDGVWRPQVSSAPGSPGKFQAPSEPVSSYPPAIQQ